MLLQVDDIFNRTEAAFPGATVRASTLDAYVEHLQEAAPQLRLPVVTQEIGDTWIHGESLKPKPFYPQSNGVQLMYAGKLYNHLG